MSQLQDDLGAVDVCSSEADLARVAAATHLPGLYPNGMIERMKRT